MEDGGPPSEASPQPRFHGFHPRPSPDGATERHGAARARRQRGARQHCTAQAQRKRVVAWRGVARRGAARRLLCTKQTKEAAGCALLKMLSPHPLESLEELPWGCERDVGGAGRMADGGEHGDAVNQESLKARRELPTSSFCR